MESDDPGEFTFTLPRVPRGLRELFDTTSVPADEASRRAWDWVNLSWIGAVVGVAPL
ncbi:hypothetical protein BJY24_002401 [Nocardia transvalensis]|uniref:Uncharacterized protein n=1 Tax=Nocardia transvalensis TaxID=37333 RepID=A0A7W9UHM2_9NOCA|nr:hypothetical protein [Nocardia transvalensis]MBB5913534.1 hypothetical protein [Nocardia transvalensis]